MKMRMIGVLLSICLLLSACEAEIHMQPQETVTTESTEQTREQEIQSTQSTTQPQETQKDTVPVKFTMGDDYYQYGNMQINLPSGNFLYYNGVVVFQAGASPTLRAYDLTTGEVRLFCVREGCDHSGGQCLGANLNGFLEQYSGKLYTRDSDYGVKVLDNGKWTELVNDAWSFWHGAGDLYVLARNHEKRELRVYAGGEGEPRTLLEDYKYYWNVVFGDYLYGIDEKKVVRVDLHGDNSAEEVLLEGVFCMVEGNHIYYVNTGWNEDRYYLYRCDMDGSNSQLLLDKPILPASMNFDDEYFYFRLYTDGELYGTLDSYDLYRFPKEDPAQIEKIVTLPASVYQVFTVPGTGKIFVTTVAAEGEDRPIYVMGTDGSNPTRLKIP